MESSKSKITHYYMKEPKMTVAMVMARLVALDGLPFRKLVTSVDVRLGLSARGFTVPKSETTVRERVMAYAETVKQLIRDDLVRRKDEGQRFSVTCDEWTGYNNRRYMNVNLHCKDQIHNIGLVRIRDSLTAEKCVKLMKDHLGEYGINAATDVISCTTDGASVMLKFGRIMPTEHQTCQSHGLHLGVCDVIYKKSARPQLPTIDEEINVNEDQQCDDDDIDSDIEVDESFTVDRCIILEKESTEIADVLCKVRKVVKVFKKSSLRNDTLQGVIKNDLGDKKQLILDTKIRWNSMLHMVDTFLGVHKQVKKALMLLEMPFDITDEELHLLEELVKCLKPIEIVVNSLGKTDFNLVKAKCALDVLLSQLEVYAKDNQHGIADKLYKSLSNRIGQRTTDLAFVANMLAKAGETKNTFEGNAAKYVIIDLALKLNIVAPDNITGVEPEVDNPEDNNPEDDNLDAEMSFAKKLDVSVNNWNVSGKATDRTPAVSVESAVQSEITILKKTGIRGKILEGVYQALLTIPPTSVEAERAFSASGLFLSRIRARMGDHTLSSLCILRKHFQSLNK